jgi:hypothetical protein
MHGAAEEEGIEAPAVVLMVEAAAVVAAAIILAIWASLAKC